MIELCKVEEASAYNINAFAQWHFTCPSCNTRCRMKSGAAEVNCGRCKASYYINSRGGVFQNEEEAPTLSTQTNTPQEVKAPYKASPRQKQGGISGLFKGIVGAAQEANEIAHGRRLKEGLLQTGEHLKTLEEHIVNRALYKFASKCNELEHQLDNWSTEGKIKMGRELQSRARKEFDFNQDESIALWLAGAWLESGCRQSDDAAFVRYSLDEIIRQ